MCETMRRRIAVVVKQEEDSMEWKRLGRLVSRAKVAVQIAAFCIGSGCWLGTKVRMSGERGAGAHAMVEFPELI